MKHLLKITVLCILGCCLASCGNQDSGAINTTAPEPKPVVSESKPAGTVPVDEAVVSSENNEPKSEGEPSEDPEETQTNTTADGSKHEPEEVSPEPAVKDVETVYSTVAKHLDKDGDLFMYWNTGRLYKEIRKEADKWQEFLTQEGTEEEKEDINEIFTFATQGIRRTGTSQIQAVGCSRIQISRHLHRGRCFVSIDSDGKTESLLDLLKAESTFDVISLLPGNTIYFSSANVEMEPVLDLIKDVEVPEKMAEMKTEWETVRKSLLKQFFSISSFVDDSCGMALIDRGEIRSRPAIAWEANSKGNKLLYQSFGRNQISPVFFAKVKDTESVENLVKAFNLRLQSSEYKDAVIYTATLKKPWMGEYVFVCFEFNGFLFVTNHMAAARSIIDTGSGGSKITARKNFKELSKNIGKEGVYCQYVSPAFGSWLMKSAKKSISKGEDSSFYGDLLLKSNYAMYSTVQRLPDGLCMTTHSTGYLLHDYVSPIVGSAGAVALSEMAWKELAPMDQLSRLDTISDMKTILETLKKYANRNQGKLPKDGFEGLSALVAFRGSGAKLTPDDLISSVSGITNKKRKLSDKYCSYIYVGEGIKLDKRSHRKLPILVTKRDTIPNETVVILADGSVEVISDRNVVKALSAKYKYSKSMQAALTRKFEESAR